MCHLSVSPGDWDAARERWPGSVCHLWSKGNPFLSLTMRGLIYHFGYQPIHSYFASFASAKSTFVFIPTIMSVVHVTSPFVPLLVFFFSINLSTLRDTELAKMNG